MTSRSDLEVHIIPGAMGTIPAGQEGAASQTRLPVRIFEQITRNIQDAVLVTEAATSDFAASRILYVNPAFERMTGYTAAEVLGETPQRLYGEKTDPRVLGRIRTALQRREAVTVELIHYRKDGTQVDVEQNIEPLLDDTGKATHWLSIQRDAMPPRPAQIRRRGEAERTLQESQEHLRIAIDSANLGLWKWNLQTGKIVWSGYSGQLFGLKPGQFDDTYEMFFQRVHPDDRAALAEARTHARATASKFEYLFRVIWSDGAIHWLSGSGHFLYDTEGNVTYLVGAFFDVTERQRLQEERHHLVGVADSHVATLATARRVAMDILLNRTGMEVLKHIAEAARISAQARYAAIGIADSKGENLQDLITVGLTAEDERSLGPRPEGDGILGLLLERDKPLRLEGLAANPASMGLPPRHPPIGSLLGVPIRTGGKVLGSLYLMNPRGGEAFTDADEAAVVALADYTAVAIHYQHLLHQQSMLTHRFINTLEEERRSVSYELHDGLTQYLMTAHIYLNNFFHRYHNTPEAPVPKELAQGLKYLEQAVGEARRFVSGLRSLELDDLGLVGALERLLGEEKVRADWKEVEFQHDLAGQRFDTALETAVFRVAQEALTNARKYAESSRIQVVLMHSEGIPSSSGAILLEVCDWGKGFDPKKTRESYDHLGMHSMEERVLLMKGRFEMVSAPGQGTRIRAVFPLGD